MPLIKKANALGTADSMMPPEQGQVCTVSVNSGNAVPRETFTALRASDDRMSKAEWAAKDRRIGRAGLYQAALQSVGVLQYSPSVRSLEDYLKLVRHVAEDGLKFVHEVE